MNLQLIFKNKKISVPLLLALISTIFQIVLFKSCQTLSQKSTDNNKYAVIVASKAIQQNTSLNLENTKLIYLNLGDTKSQFILNSQFQSYLGRKIKINVDENTPILKNLVTKNSQNLTLLEKIPPGKRFFAVDVDLSSLSSLLKVGDRVDIIAHMDINGFGKATENILNGVKVIGIGNVFEEKISNPDTNTLSFYLTQEEVKIISFMKTYSQFSVAIRNPNDTADSENDSITFNKFLQNEKIQKIFKNDSFKIIEGKKYVENKKFKNQ